MLCKGLKALLRNFLGSQDANSWMDPHGLLHLWRSGVLHERGAESGSMPQDSFCRKCLRGVYSCRWRSGSQNKHRCSCCWFFFLALACLLKAGWIYVCWAAINDRDDVNWKAFSLLRFRWVNWFIVVVIMSSVLVSYSCLLLVFALFQVALREPLNLHCTHKVLLLLAVLIIAAGVAGICLEWKEEWLTVFMSLQMTGPFLQIGGVVSVSLLGWFVFQRFFMARRAVSRVVILLAYLVVGAAVFLSPLLISSPCFLEKHNLPPKPALIGHRGAPTMSPENTMLSFRRSLECDVKAFETDVIISQNGIPFLMHDDKSLRRTTDVSEKFPGRVENASHTFTWDELKTLNAGDWFLKSDPFHTVSSLSEEDKVAIRNQTIPALTELLDLAKQHKTSIIFDLKGDSDELNVTLRTVQAILDSNIPQEQVLWLPSRYRKLVKMKAPDFKHVYANKSLMEDDGGDQLNLKYSSLTPAEIRDLRRGNVSVNLYVVNESWLFSLLWCSGVTSVTTNTCRHFKNMTQPAWILAPDTYTMLWITVDSVFLLVILGLFLLQRRRFTRGTESEEHRNGYSVWNEQELDTFL
ncbi:glycerophosphoinositol inositolphosphodiesterase GDPD2 isoform X1 [Lepisosteus oculatus]|uniref:glycerophosphoinositol inositolphosphodiesterase GDPD2 isoform X1 n=1 Tax=Lepisosteus oculatus TaxID=7918 RepID=UPI00371F0E06